MARASQNYYPDGEYLDKRNRVFGLKDEILQKLDSIPEVVDNLTSTSTTAALSANMGRRLNQRINSIEGGTRFLSLWDCAQGQPVSFPEHIPYAYETGDNYLVSNVSDGGTNFRPDGDAFSGQQSGVEETETVKPGDMYMYDGTNWLLQSNTPVVVDPTNTKTFYLSGSGSSATVLAEAQAAYDRYIDGKNPIIMYSGRSYLFTRDYYGALRFASPNATTNPYSSVSSIGGDYYLALEYDNGTVTNVGAGSGAGTLELLATNSNYSNPFIPTNPGQPTTKKYVDDSIAAIDLSGKQDKLVAGENITIQDVCHPDTQGPCPDGFHLPVDELKNVLNIVTNTFSNCGFSSNMEVPENVLKMPRGGRIRDDNGDIYERGNVYYYWNAKTSWSYYAAYGGAFYANGDDYYHWHADGGYATANGFPIRAFKDVPVQPDNTRTVIYDGSAIATGAGVFYNATDGLISISGDGTTRYTMMDKNLGATQVYNYGDTLSDSNCGLYYQWGNNHGFPSDLTGVTTSTTKVDATGYGPGKYYNSDVFIISTQDPWSWLTVTDRTDGTYGNLWGKDNPTGTWCEPVISAVVPDSAQWGNITGTLSDQTDLQSALDSKEDISNKTNQVFTPGTLPDSKQSNTWVLTDDGLHGTEFDGDKAKTYLLSTPFDVDGEKTLLSTVTAPGDINMGFLTNEGTRLVMWGDRSSWRIMFGVESDYGGTPFLFSDQGTELTLDEWNNGGQTAYFKSTTDLTDQLYSGFNIRDDATQQDYPISEWKFMGMSSADTRNRWYLYHPGLDKYSLCQIGESEWSNYGFYNEYGPTSANGITAIRQYGYYDNAQVYGDPLNTGTSKWYQPGSGYTGYRRRDANVAINEMSQQDWENSFKANGNSSLGTYRDDIKFIGGNKYYISGDRYLGYNAIKNGILTKYNIVKDYLYRQEDNDNRVASQRSVESLNDNKQDRVDYPIENQNNKVKDFTYFYTKEKDFYNKEIDGQQVAISGPHYVIYADDGYHAGLICTDRNSGYHSYIGQIQTQRSFNYETDLPNMVEIDFNDFHFDTVNSRYVTLGNDGLHLILRDGDCTHPLVITTSVPWDFTPANCTWEIQQPRDPNDTQQGNIGYTSDGLRIYTYDGNIYQTDTPFNFNESHLTFIQNFNSIINGNRWNDQEIIRWSPDGKYFNLSGYWFVENYWGWHYKMFSTKVPYQIVDIERMTNYGYENYDDMYLGTPTPIGCTRTNGPAYWWNPITYFYVDTDTENINKYPSMKALSEYVKANAGGQVDWNQTDITAKDYIKNKPTELGNVSNNRGTVTSGNIAVFDGTTGKLIRDKGLSIINTDTAPAGLGASQVYYDHGHIYIVSPSYQVQLENDDILLLENDDILLF